MKIAGLKIAIVGDSHTQTKAGLELVRLLEAEGATVTNLGIGATAAPQWLKTPVCQPKAGGCVKPPKNRIIDLDAEVQKAGGFDLVIVSLGTNDGANASAAGNPGGVKAGSFPQQIAAIMQRVAPLGFYMGPPKMRGTVKHYADANIQPYFDAAEGAFGGAAINGYNVTASYAAKDGDGVHYYGSGAKAWAKAVATAILSRDPYAVKPMSGGTVDTGDDGVIAPEPPISTFPWLAVGIFAAVAGAAILLTRPNR